MSPSVVIYPSTTEEVATIVRIATKYKVPITVYSGATSLEGHYRAVCIVFFLTECTIDCHLALDRRNLRRYEHHGWNNCDSRYAYVIFRRCLS